MKNKLFPVLFLSGLIYASSDFANAKESNYSNFKLTLGIGTPITGNQDIYKSNNTTWEQGDIIGTAIISTNCFSTLDCSLWHHSIIADTKDVGVTGISITKTWNFTW